MLKKTFGVFLIVILLLCTVRISAASAAPGVSAQSAVVLCADDNSVVYEKNSHQRLPMASTTKIMTCLIALENADVTQTVEISPKAVGIEGSSLYLCEGDSATLLDLLYGVMLRSANDAAAAVAYHVSGSIENFALLMNQKAEELGLSDTHFTNPHGLHDDSHYTTAYDFAVLASYAMKNETFAKIVSAKEHTVALNDGELKKPVANHNKLLRIYDGANGVKTGFTKDSGRCLVSSAKRDGVNLVAVTLNAPNDWADHMALLDYGFSQFTHMIILEKGEIRRQFDVVGCECVDGVNTEEISMTVRKGTEIGYRIEGPHLTFSPVLTGDTLATVIVTVNGKEIAEVPLLATEDRVLEEPPSLFEKLFGKHGS